MSPLNAVLTIVMIVYREYATDVNILVSKQAISSIGNVALRLPELAHTCVKKLLSLLSYNISCVTSNVLVCLTSECVFLLSRWDLHLDAMAYNMVYTCIVLLKQKSLLSYSRSDLAVA